MHLKISSPEKNIFEGSIRKITIPTEAGMLTILPEHAPMVTALKPGVINVYPTEMPGPDFIFENDSIALSVGKGMVFVDGKMVRIVTAVATTSLKDSENTLQTMKHDLEDQIKKLKVK